MSIEKVIRDRRTVHAYLAEEVPKELLNQALELAIMAPNHRLTFPFLFINVGPTAREKIADLAYELKGQKEPIRKKFLTEGSITFFAQKKNEDELIEKEDYATLASAIQNFSLFMWEKGYGTKWSSGGIIRSSETYKILDVDSEKYEIVAMVWSGKYKCIPKTPQRPELQKFLKFID